MPKSKSGQQIKYIDENHQWFTSSSTLERMQPQKRFQALWSISQKCQRSMGIEEASSYLNSFPIYHHTSVGRPKTTSDRRLFHIICLKPLIARLPCRLIWSQSSKLGPQAQIGRISLDPLFLNLGTDYNNSSRLHLNRETGFECKTRTRPKTCWWPIFAIFYVSTPREDSSIASDIREASGDSKRPRHFVVI